MNTNNGKSPFVSILLFLVIVIPIVIYDYAVRLPKAKELDRQLEKEFKLIAAMPRTTSNGYEATHGTSKAQVRMYYGTYKTLPEVRQFYRNELTKNGWYFVEEKDHNNWRGDIVDIYQNYCKANYVAVIDNYVAAVDDEDEKNNETKVLYYSVSLYGSFDKKCKKQ